MAPFEDAKPFIFCYTSLIPLNPANHRAQYDRDGNIILPGASTEPVARLQDIEDMEDVTNDSEAVLPKMTETNVPAWQMAERIIQDSLSPEYEPVHMAKEPRVIHTHLTTLQSVTRDALKEGIRQYKESIAQTEPMLEEFEDETASMTKRLWRFLVQPVWVPGRKKTVKKYSRGTLFVIDVARFGGTFAMIFGGLFVALNYQSYWQIATAQISPLLTLPSVSDNPATEKNSMLGDVTNPSAIRVDGNLASYLPQVGPPDDLIIIPKLNVVAPFHDPSLDNLLAKNWDGVEQDIQKALETGVVHYPGTAKPGQAGNFFITGHSSYYPLAPGDYKTIFARLHQLNVGDEYWVYYKGDKHRYIVESKKEVSPADISVLDQPVNKRIATLMTCTPVGTTLRRLIVQSKEVDPMTGEDLAVGENATRPDVDAVSLEALPI